ncbi:hypothetical protein [Bacillus methanolicus]|uniref:Putative membrane protein n=1 Tax=Bacillus methanolicus (strain MGA3 / ATCC 53907) TaxID=796606 RepID=I3E7F5_BACMM|nr:hypothetical protein [Bacillus methanolicus]AIE59253.1 putative membrane protein [Bacillus methanolicus MGA3]EIJ82426.1 hypothetical protein MGA3_04250 [Bacillus methanolicus MGA3]UQD51327.1 hypothetical protein C0971_04315 [Bacillus methanolicus]
MDGIIFGFFVLSAVLLIGTVLNLIATKKPGIYPPKYILKKRAGILAAGGIAVLFLGILLLSFR